MKVDINNLYQTMLLNDGTVINGAFDTIRWFNLVSDHVSFKDMVMLDIGCCQFSYGIQAINNGASHIIGVDSDQLRIDQSDYFINSCGYKDKTTLIKSFAEELEVPDHDIVLFSMVIHWMKDPEFHIKRILSKSSTAIFMYRLRGYDDDSGYLPTRDELDALVGTKSFVYETVSDTKEQNIRLAIYKLRD